MLFKTRFLIFSAATFGLGSFCQTLSGMTLNQLFSSNTPPLLTSGAGTLYHEPVTAGTNIANVTVFFYSTRNCSGSAYPDPHGAIREGSISFQPGQSVTLNATSAYNLIPTNQLSPTAVNCIQIQIYDSTGACYFVTGNSNNPTFQATCSQNSGCVATSPASVNVSGTMCQA